MSDKMREVLRPLNEARALIGILRPMGDPVANVVLRLEAIVADLEALQATPSRPVSGEPVAWRYRFITTTDGKEWSDWFIVDDRKSIPARDGQMIQPLYTAPPLAAGREEIAAYLLALEDTDIDKLPSASLIEHQRRLVVRFKNEKHEGDCTKVAGTCSRCVVDTYLRHADAILALGSAVTPQEGRAALSNRDEVSGLDICADCPSAGYPTDETRCSVCPRRTTLPRADRAAE